MAVDQNQIVRFKKAVADDSPVLVWVAEWLEHLNMFSEAQIYDIIRFAKPRLLQHKQLNLLTLAVCDSRWVAVVGKENFWDTSIAEEINQLPRASITIITCDCLALIERKLNGQSRKLDSADSN